MAAYFTSVVNNPRQTWSEYLGLPEDLDEYTLDDVKTSVSSYVLPSTSTATPVVQERVLGLADFKDYMRKVGEPYAFMIANRPQDNMSGNVSSVSASADSEAGKVAALNQVPNICFEEDFDLSRPETFSFFSPPDQPHATMVTLERLTGYLDTVCLILHMQKAHHLQHLVTIPFLPHHAMSPKRNHLDSSYTWNRWN